MLTVKDIPIVHKNKINIYYPNITSESFLLGILLAVVGGFLDAYSFVGRGGVFANAQTGNLVLVGVEIFKENWKQALITSMPIFAFIVGVFTYETIKKNASTIFIKNSVNTILIFEIVIFSIIGFIPGTVPDTFINIAISFAASLQFCSFRKLVDSPFATTMCTGNLRSASHAAYVAFTTKDNESAIKAIRYYSVILSFLFGAFLGGFLTIHIGDRAIWLASVLLAFSLVSLNINKAHYIRSRN